MNTTTNSTSVHSFDRPEDKRAKLATRIKAEGLIAAPGIFDMISAKIADKLNFDALYMTGYGTIASYLGLPDAGLASYTDMLNRVQQFTTGTRTPMICDADTGYGGLLNIMHTVRGYEAAGACMIQLEDQEFPKKCGHMPGRRVIPAEEMVKKIRVAAESRIDKNFLIIARTDARTTMGLDEALRRGELYAKAGADLLFVESPESVEEMEKIGKNSELPLVANMVEGGQTPILSKAELEKLGFKLAIFPACGFLTSGAALDHVYRVLHEQGTTTNSEFPLYDFKKFSSLMGFDEVAEFEKKHE